MADNVQISEGVLVQEDGPLIDASALTGVATQTELDALLGEPEAHIADTTGGTTVDTEVRVVVASILDALIAKGIVADEA